MSIQIDPNRGPHAAADMTDEELDFIARIVAWEVAVRTSTEHFRDHLAELSEARPQMQQAIQQVRQEREQMRFAREVLADLEQLPVQKEEEPEEVYGLYL